MRVYIVLATAGIVALSTPAGAQVVRRAPSRPGDRIRLMSRDQAEVIVVKDVRNYASFDEMASKEDLEKIAPGRSPALRVIR